MRVVSCAGCAGWLINAHLFEGCAGKGEATTVIKPLPAFRETVPVGWVAPGGEPMLSFLKFASKTVVALHEYKRMMLKNAITGK